MDSGGECGVPTQMRFPMPTPSHRQDEGWYSFEQGPVHFVMLDTEMLTGNGSAQFAFIDADLRAVSFPDALGDRVWAQADVQW